MNGKIDAQDILILNECYKIMYNVGTKEKLAEILKYDVNNDKKIDKEDIKLMTNATKEEYDVKYDINNDGKVNISGDLVELVNVLKQYGSR